MPQHANANLLTLQLSGLEDSRSGAMIVLATQTIASLVGVRNINRFIEPSVL